MHVNFGSVGIPEVLNGTVKLRGLDRTMGTKKMKDNERKRAESFCDFNRNSTQLQATEKISARALPPPVVAVLTAQLVGHLVLLHKVPAITLTATRALSEDGFVVGLGTQLHLQRARSHGPAGNTASIRIPVNW